jgi:2-haloacid dehalogenase
MDWFDGYVISGLEGVAKPDLAIFGILLSRYQLDPAATLLIDDSAANVAAARELGMHAIRHTCASRLRRWLSSLGLLALNPPPPA